MQKSRLKEKYKSQIVPQLKEELVLGNIMQVPRLEKIVLNVGSKEAVTDSKFLKLVTDVLEKIAAQTPVRTIAKKSIAGFKIREGMPLGAMVTLRGNNMYHFLDKLVNIALPKVRDFQGVPTKLDRQGNYNLGIKEWNIFPETESVTQDVNYGLNISFHTSSKNDDHARELLKKLGMPFKKV